MGFDLAPDLLQSLLENRADGWICGAVGTFSSNFEGLGNRSVLLGLVLMGSGRLGGTAGTHTGIAQRDVWLAVRHGADGRVVEVLLVLDL